MIVSGGSTWEAKPRTSEKYKKLPNDHINKNQSEKGGIPPATYPLHKRAHAATRFDQGVPGSTIAITLAALVCGLSI